MPLTTALKPLGRNQRITFAVALALTVLAGVLTLVGAGAVPQFVVAGLALAALAALVGQAIEQVGERLGPGPTGLLQSTLGNLPELFVCLFALSDGLTNVVQAALVGSILGNALLVLGMAFVAGGIRHGTQKFDPEQPRLYATLLLLVVAALLVPTLADHVGTPAAAHTSALSNGCAFVLLIVYGLSIPFYLGGRSLPGLGESSGSPGFATEAWPLRLSVTMLAIATTGAALAADWFVGPLQQATKTLGISEAFTGLVIVAIASNAVENVVGVRFALRAKPEYAISSTLSSPLQVALLLTPVLVLLSSTVGPTKLTLVFPPLLVASLAIAAVVVTVVTYDGEYTWLEGVALIGLYCIIALAFWWG